MIVSLNISWSKVYNYSSYVTKIIVYCNSVSRLTVMVDKQSHKIMRTCKHRPATILWCNCSLVCQIATFYSALCCMCSNTDWHMYNILFVVFESTPQLVPMMKQWWMMNILQWIKRIKVDNFMVIEHSFVLFFIKFDKFLV